MKTVDEIEKECGKSFNIDKIIEERGIENQKKERLVHSIEPLTPEEVEIKQKQLDMAEENDKVDFELKFTPTILEVFKRLHER